ncbi:MAG: hypothetical protein ABUR63_08340 [Verrucomicrobiota bacterium]
MTKMTRLLFTATFCLLAFAGSRASAQSCSADTDCPQTSVCAGSATSTPPVCKGTGCPADAGVSDPVVYKFCQPKTCVIDADCGGAGMICYEEKSTSCSGSGGSASGCAANTKCDAGPVITTVETCMTTTRNVCAFKWQVPCNADTDCGDRFVCQPTVSGGCVSSSGGVSAGPSGAGGAASGGAPLFRPAADAGTPECHTVTSFPGSCTPKATTCMGDTECPSGWTCTAIGTPEPVTATGTKTSVSIQGDASAAPPADSVDAGGSTTKICVGPLGAGLPTRGVEVGTSGNAPDAPHQGTDAAVPSSSLKGGPTGGATGGATGSVAATSGSSGGGCAIAPAGARDSALLLMGVVTIGLALARRRARK